MAKKTNILKNFLTTASALAVMAGGIGEAMAVAAARSITADGYDLTVGTNLNGAAAFVNLSTLEFAAQATGATGASDFNILAIDTHGVDLTGRALTITAGQNLSVGSIVNRGAAGNALDANPAVANRLNITLAQAGDTLALTGTGSAPLGFITPGGPLHAPADNYSALGVINFGVGGGGLATILQVNAVSTHPINLINASVINTANAILSVDTDLTVNNATFATIKDTGIAAGKKFTINAGNNNLATIAGATYVFASGDSTLRYAVNTVGNKTIDLQSNISLAAVADEMFKLEIDATGASDTLTVTKTGGGTVNIGATNAKRAKELRLSGTRDITFTDKVNVFSKSIVQAGTGTVTFTNAINSGGGSSLTFEAAGQVRFVENATIAFSNFNAHAGRIIVGAGRTLASIIDNDSAAAQAVADVVATAYDGRGAGVFTGANTDTAIATSGNATAIAASAAYLFANPGASKEDVLTAALAAIGGQNAYVAAAFTGVAGGTAAHDAVTAIFETPAGIIEYKGAGVQTGAIGVTNPVVDVILGNGEVTFSDVVKSENISLGHANSKATFAHNAEIEGNVRNTSLVDGQGTLEFAQDSIVNGEIGANGAKLALVKQAAAGTVQYQGNVFTTALNLNHAGAIAVLGNNVTLTGNITGTGQVTFVDDGAVTGAIAGKSVTQNNAGTVNYGGNITVTHNLTLGDANAIAIFGNNAGVTGNIAGVGQVRFAENGAVTGTIAAASVTQVGAGTVNYGDMVTSNLTLTAAGSIANFTAGAAARGVTGNILGAGQVQFQTNGTVTGTIAAASVTQVGAGTVDYSGMITSNLTLTAAGSIANFTAGAGRGVTGNILGAGQVQFQTNGAVTGTIVGKLVKQVGAGTVTYGGNITVTDGLNLHNAAAIAVLADGVKITGLVDATNGAGEGILRFVGSGEVTDTIGVATNPLAEVQFKGGAGTTAILGDVAKATDFKFYADGTATIRRAIHGAIDFQTQAATLNVNSNGGGAIDLATATVTTGGNQPDNATINIQSETSAPGAEFTLIKETHIADTVKYTLTHAGGHLTVAPNALAGSAFIFDGATSHAVFDIDATGDQNLLFGRDIGGVEDVGILEIKATNGGTLTVAGDGGAITLGIDPTNRLKRLKTSGTQEITFNNTVDIFAKEIELGSTGNVTFVKAINSGLASRLVFSAITPEVQLNGDNVFTTIDFGNKASEIKLAAAGTITTNAIQNGGTGILTFEGAGELAPQTVGGGITATLSRINVGAGAVKLGKGNYTVTEIRSAGAHATTLADGFELTGAIDSTGGGNAPIILKGSGKVTGTVGAGAPVGNITMEGTAAGNKVFDFEGDVDTHGAGDLIFDTGTPGTAAGTVKFRGDFDGTGQDITFTEDGTIVVYGDADHAITADDITIPNNATRRGTIKIENSVAADKVVTITGKIGDSTHEDAALKELIVGTEGTVVLTAGGNEVANIRSVEFISNGTWNFTQANGEYRVHGITNAAGNTGKLRFEEDTKFIANGKKVEFGTEVDPLHSVIFPADKTVTVGADIHIHARTLDNKTDGHGKFTFAGDGTLDIGGGRKIHTLTLNGANSTVNILKDFRSVDAVVIPENATLYFGRDVRAIAIDGADGIKSNNANGGGTLIFENQGELIVNSAIGGTKAVRNLELRGQDVKFMNNTLAVQNVLLTTPDRITVTTTGVDIGAANIVNNSPDNKTHKVIVDVDQDITGNIGTAARPIGDIELHGGGTIRIGTNNFYAGITSDRPNSLNLELNIDGLVLSRAGTANDPLLKIAFNQNGTISGDTYAATAEIAKGKSGTFGGILSATDLTLGGENSVANFADGAIMNSTISTKEAGQGTVNFDGSAEVKKVIGSGNKLKEVNFNADDLSKKVVLSANINAKANFKKSSASLENDITFGAGARLEGTALDVRNRKLTINGGDVELAGDVKLGSTINQSSLGTIVVNVGKLDYTNLTSLVIVLDDTNSPSIDGNKTYTLLSKGSGTVAGVDSNKIRIGEHPNRLVNWTVAVDANGNIILTQIDQKEKVTTEDLAALGVEPGVVSVAEALKFEQAEPGTDGDEVKMLLRTVDKETRADIYKRLLNTTAPAITEVVDAVVSEVVNAVTNDIGSRIATLITPTAFISTSSPATPSSTAIKVSENSNLMTGVAAGDDPERYGIWVSPLYSNSTQKKRGVIAGHRAVTTGLTAGFDTKATDDLIIGAAASYIDSDVKHKDFKKGDKTDIKSFMFSAYGVQQIMNEFYIQGLANVGSSSISNKETRRTGTNSTQVAKGKYDSMSFSAELLGGYNCNLNNQAVITPMIGAGFSRMNDGSYKETGTTNQNLEVTKKASSKIEAIIGARVMTAPLQLNDMLITPEVHGFIRHDLRADPAKVDIRLDGIAGNLSSRSAKATKTFYNVGASLGTKYSYMEYGLGYDLNVADKYTGHQGSFKVRVNF